MPVLRSLRFSRLLASSLLPLLALAACVRQGRFTAQLDGDGLHESWSGPAHAAWCRSRGVLLLDGGEGDRGISFVWFYGDSLRADSVTLGRPMERAAGDSDSTRSVASGALRRVAEVNAIGYQTRYGFLDVTRPDSAHVGAAFSAMFDRLGVGESLRVTGRFDRVPLAADSSLCAVPREPPDTGVPLTR